MQIKEINQLKEEIESILNDNKAIEVKSINLKGKTSIADFMIIASGNSSRHIQALSEILVNKLKEKGINMVRGGPFCWIRDYNNREQVVINFFINEMVKGWDNFLMVYNIFKHFHEDDFYVYTRGFGSKIPAWLFTKKSVGIFNCIINHIKDKPFKNNIKPPDKDTLYINLNSAMNIIKSVTIENKLTNKNIENKLNNIQSLLIKQNDDMLNLTQKVNLIGQKRNFNEIETNDTGEAGQINEITETIIIGETITIIEDVILSEPPTKKRKISEDMFKE